MLVQKPVTVQPSPLACQHQLPALSIFDQFPSLIRLFLQACKPCVFLPIKLINYKRWTPEGENGGGVNAQGGRDGQKLTQTPAEGCAH